MYRIHTHRSVEYLYSHRRLRGDINHREGSPRANGRNTEVEEIASEMSRGPSPGDEY